LSKDPDAGWRYQTGNMCKYTDPKKMATTFGMDENFLFARWEHQAAYINSAIMNFSQWSHGMAIHPGTALGRNGKINFFLVEFVGNPSNRSQPYWSFDLKPKGCLLLNSNKEQDILSGILPTGIRFAPDVLFTIADWMNGLGHQKLRSVWQLVLLQQKRP